MLDQHFLQSLGFGSVGIFRILLFRCFIVAVDILERWDWKNPEDMSALCLQTRNSAIPVRHMGDTC